MIPRRQKLNFFPADPILLGGKPCHQEKILGRELTFGFFGATIQITLLVNRGQATAGASRQAAGLNRPMVSVDSDEVGPARVGQGHGEYSPMPSLTLAAVL